MIAHTLRDDGYPADDNEWNPLEQNSRADAFEYVMHGKIYRIDGDDGPGDASRLWVAVQFRMQDDQRTQTFAIHYPPRCSSV